MAKQPKTVQSTPEIYKGFTQNPADLNRTVIIDLNENISVFDTPATLEGYESYEAIIKPSIAYRWDGFNKFEEMVNEQTALARHEQLFGGNPPKKQQLTLTKLMVWHKLCQTAKNKVISSVPKSDTGRKSTILNSEYSKGEVKEGYADIKTYQAQQCAKLFQRCIKDQPMVTEGVLRKFIEDNAGELKTRQDPWRIFQYYRKDLINAKILRRK